MDRGLAALAIVTMLSMILATVIVLGSAMMLIILLVLQVILA